MTTQPIRADWWREVTDPNEIIPAGCPVRFEDEQGNYYASERIVPDDFPWRISGGTVRVFIDSRWTPPRPTYKVRDVIENNDDVKYLPDGSVFLDCDRHAWQLDDGIAYAAGGGRWFVDGDFDYLPLTVIYVPKAKG